jgi:hypothetical protein
MGWLPAITLVAVLLSTCSVPGLVMVMQHNHNHTAWVGVQLRAGLLQGEPVTQLLHTHIFTVCALIGVGGGNDGYMEGGREYWRRCWYCRHACAGVCGGPRGAYCAFSCMSSSSRRCACQWGT